MRFHIHPVTGVPAKCNSKKGNCPFGNKDTEHYSSKEEARIEYEKSMTLNVFSPKVDTFSPLKKSVINLIEKQLIREEYKNYPDIISFLNKGIKDLKNIKSSEDINRLLTIYQNISDTAWNDGRKDLSEVAEFLSSSINLVINYGNFKKDLHKNLSSFSDVEKEKIEQHFINRFKFLNERKLNKEIIENPKTGDTILIPGHEITLISDDGDKRTIREILTGKTKDGIYIGRVSINTNTKAYKIINENAEKLNKILEKTFKDDVLMGDFVDFDNSSEFKFLSSGMENNVYLHIPTQIVYKTPHHKTFMLRHKNMETAIVDIKNAYENIDYQKLKNLEVEYAPTWFINFRNSNNKLISFIAQPYLNPEIYIPYSPEANTQNILRTLGFSDLSDDNIRINIKTKEVVLFDCLFDV